MLTLGTVIAERFRLEKEISRGSSGKVYLASDLQSGSKVALKILERNATEGGEFLARFHRECKLLEELQHPNAVRVLETGITQYDQPFVVMEQVEGRTLSQIVREKGPLSPRRVARYLMDVASVVDFAHSRGIVHRDLKPGNIMVGVNAAGEEFVKVVDFGVAKIVQSDRPDNLAVTAAGIAMGTPEYMSPEQAMGKPLDHHADIYSLGVTLYAILTATLPFEEKNPLKTMLAHVKAPIPRFSERNPRVKIPLAVEGVVRQAMAKDPRDRFKSATELARFFSDAVLRPEEFLQDYPSFRPKDEKPVSATSDKVYTFRSKSQPEAFKANFQVLLAIAVVSGAVLLGTLVAFFSAGR